MESFLRSNEVDVDLEKGLNTVQRSFNKRIGEYKGTKAGYWRSVPISQEVHEVLRNLKSGEEFVLPKLLHWRQSQQEKTLRDFCRANKK